jgi:hypothetical protein
MVRKIYTTLIILSLSAIAFVYADEPQFPGLRSNERYMALKKQNGALLEREDSIQLIINSTREEFNRKRSIDSIIISPTDIEQFTSHILTLEEQIFELRQQRGDVITELNNIEQEYILAHMFSSSPIEESDNTVPSNNVIQNPILIKNDIFRDNLSEVDYEELEAAQDEDDMMMELCNEYASLYNDLSNTSRLYMQTTSESVADSLFSVYNTLKTTASVLNEDIDRQWAHIIDTKYYAYGYILEKNNRYDLLDSSSAKFSEMQQRCANEDGIYNSDAVMHYAIGYPTLLDYEIAVAQEMGLTEALSALQSKQKSLVVPEYKYEIIDMQRRLFLDYAPIKVGKTNFYNNNNPVPELKVYERGTIYRILLGTFRTKQPMTLFKGIQPLYITQDENKEYSYYVGGFATLKEAEEAQLFLKDKDFKRPEICRWRDGEMINIDNLSKNEDDTENVAPVGSRYVVILDCSTISDALRETITSTSPDKSISRRGAQFAIGTFTDHSEADLLLSTIEEKHPEITVSIEELNF